jgi:hypothetical protein
MLLEKYICVSTPFILDVYGFNSLLVLYVYGFNSLPILYVYGFISLIK